MKKWQKIWLYFLIIFALIHFVRDILQDLGVKMFLSTVLVKKPLVPVVSSVLWNIFDTYLFAIVEIILAIYCLMKNRFEKIGILTIVIAIGIFTAWSIYWIHL